MLRHTETLHVGVVEFQTKVVPYPRIHFVVSLGLSSSSDEHHCSHSCLGTSMRVGKHIVIIVHLRSIGIRDSSLIRVGVLLGAFFLFVCVTEPATVSTYCARVCDGGSTDCMLFSNASINLAEKAHHEHLPLAGNCHVLSRAWPHAVKGHQMHGVLCHVPQWCCPEGGQRREGVDQDKAHRFLCERGLRAHFYREGELGS